MEGAWKELCKGYGYGSFMAGQIVADLRWAMKGEWRDRNEWAPVGPGSARGLARLLYAPDSWTTAAKGYVNDPADWLTDFKTHILEKIPQLLPSAISSRLEAHDYQNCLCEYDKYNRVLFGEGKPKQLYKPGK